MSVEENSQSLAEALMAKHGVADSPAESISESATSTAVPSDVESESVNPTDENTTTPSSSASSPKVNGSTKKNLDISSYDAFPILGGGKASTASAVSWGPNATVKPVATPKAPARTAAKPTQKSIVTESFTLKLEQRNARAKAIPSEVLSRAQSNNSVSIDCSTSKSTRASHFIIKGKLENVHKARRELLRELSIRVTEVFQVPASVRALIIGPKGSNLDLSLKEVALRSRSQRRRHTRSVAWWRRRWDCCRCQGWRWSWRCAACQEGHFGYCCF